MSYTKSAHGRRSMRYAVFLDPVTEPGFSGYYYAHIPSVDLTTHGQGWKEHFRPHRNWPRHGSPRNGHMGKAFPSKSAP